MSTKPEFKKGQKVVVYSGDFYTCNVTSEVHTVLSCGLKQMHLLRHDGSNAEFRLYAPFRGERRYSDVQCATVNVAQHTLKLRKQFAAWTAEHFAIRTANAEEQIKERGRTPGTLGYARAIAEGKEKFEQCIADLR